MNTGNNNICILRSKKTTILQYYKSHIHHVHTISSIGKLHNRYFVLIYYVRDNINNNEITITNKGT